MKLFFSLLSLGTTVGGIFVGSVQQNVLKTEKPYIDVLFEEIEKDIRDFSNRNPLTETQAKQIKTGNSSATETQIRRKRSSEINQEAKPENTLGVWTNIWIGLLSSYIQKLWIGDQENIDASTKLDEKSRNFSNKQKQEAIKKADISNKDEKERFKKQVKEKEIESIYEKMKKFLLRIEFPETYRYNTSTNTDCPYENYIEGILKN